MLASSSQPEPQPLAANRATSPGLAAVAKSRGPTRAAFDPRTIFVGAALFAIAVACYAPAIRDGFIWDDDAYVTQNMTLRSLHGLWQMWFVPLSLPQYYPLVHTTFWIEYHLWGLNPAGYHAVNVLLHATSALLLWRLLARLKMPGAWLAAALFAVHPVHVESVAWITERKNVLSLTLVLASLLCYLRFAPVDDDEPGREAEPTSRGGGWGWYASALVLFIAALLSKTVVASAPAVLLVILWWKRGRIGRHDVMPLIPFLVLGIAAGAHTAWLERSDVGAVGAEWDFSPADRILIAGRAAWFYALKLAWPQPLMFFYPRWVIDDHAAWQYSFPIAALILVLVLWLARKKIGRGPLAAALIFGGVLVPVSGFFNVYPFRFSFVADHFQYHASIALLALVAAGVALVIRMIPRDSQGVGRFASGVVLVVLAVVTCRRTSVFHDPEALYRDTISKNPQCVIALANLALHLADQGRSEEALPLAREGARLGPREAAAQNNLGLVLLRSGEQMGFRPGQFEEAIEHLQESVKANPKYMPAHSNLAYTFLMRGRADEAVEHFVRILEDSPTNARALYGMGACLESQGKKEQAIDYYRRSVESDPDLAQPRYNLARLLLDEGNLDEGIEHLQGALRVDSANADGYFQLGNALLRRGDIAGAAQQFHTVVRLRPNHVSALVNLGIALVNLRQIDQALQFLQEAIRQQPDSVKAHYGLSTALAQKGAIAEAVQQLQVALQLDPQHAAAHFDLANLLIGQGDVRAAIEHYNETVRLQPDHVEALLNLGAAELKLGEADAAARHLAEAVRLRPDNAQARTLLQQAQGAARQPADK